MAVGYVIPDSDSALDFGALITALEAELNISSAEQEIGIGASGEGGVLNETRLRVTGTAGADITNAIAAVGNCQLEPGTVIV